LSKQPRIGEECALLMATVPMKGPLPRGDFAVKKKNQKQSRTLESKPAASEPTQVAAPDAVPDLSHIAEDLRPLAIPCSSIHFDPANARLHPDESIEAIMKSLSIHDAAPELILADKLVVRSDRNTGSRG
jgi:hypothetical protein